VTKSSLVVWTNRALADIEEIYEYVAADKPVAERKLAEKLLLAGDALATHPYLGRVTRPGNIRELVIGSYLLAYRVVDPGPRIEILAVVHGARRRRTR
jgi:addiction module RelE/StbE family toxin